MNLFRSKEDILDWSGFEAGTEDGILTLAQAAVILSTPRHAGRMREDYVSTLPDFLEPFIDRLMEVTGNSPYWDPRP
ncbi:MAG: hypothetical protein QF654_02925 [Alphaproteobacteria bacterium]|jgi:phage baseplate assembly protein W|nr:hypothetical protein [Alphaproteobacteria bacterium]